MTEEHFTKAAPIECRLMSAVMEIDDDDEDVIQVTVDLANESAIPVGSLDIFIQTSDNKKVESKEGISSLGPGLTRTFSFEFPLSSGNWTFMLRSPSLDADLGPYEHDFTYQAKKGRVFNNAIGSGMFTDAFTSEFGEFGNVEERGVIDAAEIKLTSYYGENAEGGSTAISVGAAAEAPPEEAARTPPWEKSSDILSAPLTPKPVAKTPPVAQESAPSADILSFSKSLAPVAEQQPKPNTAATPPPLPTPAKTTVAADDEINNPPPSGPPSAPPSAPPSSPPSGPPTAPPSKPTSRPPTGPPSKPSSKPPSGPPSGPPTAPPNKPTSRPPTGPPSKPSSKPPSGPPSSPPSGKPTGPPKSKKPTRPPM